MILKYDFWRGQSIEQLLNNCTNEKWYYLLQAGPMVICPFESHSISYIQGVYLDPQVKGCQLHGLNIFTF